MAINRREFLKKSTLAFGGLSLSKLSKFGNDKPSQRPNIVFVFADQMRRQALGFTHQDPVHTPNLNRFASQGLYMPNTISNRPLCSPFRAMMVTGKFPYCNDVVTNCNSSTTKYNNYLKKTERIFTDVLSENGYNVGYIGKWHMDPPTAPDATDWRKAEWGAFVPPERRHGIDFWHAYNDHNRHDNPYYWTTHAKADEKTVIHEWSPRHEAGVAIDYIENRNGKHRNSDKPFALFWSMNPPHPPFHEVPQEYLDRYDGKAADELLNRPNVPEDHKPSHQNIKNYLAMVTGVDEQFGRLLDTLKKNGLHENTIVVFTADHGEMMGSHGLMGKNYWYEESSGIPFLIRWPGKINQRSDNLLFNVPDMMPTLLGLTGIDDVPYGVQGTDYSPILLGEKMTRPDSSLYMRTLKPSDDFGTAKGGRGVRTHTHTFVIDWNNNEKTYYLFNNETDPYQMNNIADQNPALVKELSQKTKEWLEYTDDPWFYKWDYVS